MTNFRSNFDETYPWSDQVGKIRLLANTEVTWTVPGITGQLYRAHFTYPSDAEFWVALNATVINPIAGTAITVSNEEFRPDNLYVHAGDELHFISTGTPQIGVSLLALPG